MGCFNPTVESVLHFHTTEAYLSHGYSQGVHPTTHPLTQLTQQYQQLRNSPFSNTLSNADDLPCDRNDATFYSASYPSGELELYPLVEPLPDGWYVIEWPGHAVSSPSDLQAAIIHGKYLCDFLFGWLTHSSQNQWLRPLLKPPHRRLQPPIIRGRASTNGSGRTLPLWLFVLWRSLNRPSGFGYIYWSTHPS